MRFMVIVKCSEEPENQAPDPQLMADLNKFNDELLGAGVLIGYDGLHPSSKGARVHFSGKNRPTSLTAPSREARNRRQLILLASEASRRRRKVGPALPKRRRDRHRGSTRSLSPKSSHPPSATRKFSRKKPSALDGGAERRPKIIPDSPLSSLL